MGQADGVVQKAAGQGDAAVQIQPQLHPGHRGGADPAELLPAAGVPESDGILQPDQPPQHGQGHRVGADGAGAADGGKCRRGADRPGRGGRHPYHGDGRRRYGAVRHPAGRRRRGRVRAVLGDRLGAEGQRYILLSIRRRGVPQPYGHAGGVPQPDGGRGVRLRLRHGAGGAAEELSEQPADHLRDDRAAGGGTEHHPLPHADAADQRPAAGHPQRPRGCVQPPRRRQRHRRDRPDRGGVQQPDRSPADHGGRPAAVRVRRQP